MTSLDKEKEEKIHTCCERCDVLAGHCPHTHEEVVPVEEITTKNLEKILNNQK